MIYYQYTVVKGGDNLTLNDLKKKGLKAKFTSYVLDKSPHAVLTKKVSTSKAQEASTEAKKLSLEGETNYEINKQNCVTQVKKVLNAAGVSTNGSSTVCGAVMDKGGLKSTMSGGASEKRADYKIQSSQYRRSEEENENSLDTFKFNLYYGQFYIYH